MGGGGGGGGGDDCCGGGGGAAVAAGSTGTFIPGGGRKKGIGPLDNDLVATLALLLVLLPLFSSSFFFNPPPPISSLGTVPPRSERLSTVTEDTSASSLSVDGTGAEVECCVAIVVVVVVVAVAVAVASSTCAPPFALELSSEMYRLFTYTASIHALVLSGLRSVGRGREEGDQVEQWVEKNTALPPAWRDSISSLLNFDIEMPLTRWPYCRLREVACHEGGGGVRERVGGK